MLSWLKNCQQWFCNVTSNTIGTGIAATGMATEQMALVVIMFGVLLWMFKSTKVFRWGLIVYLIGLILELIGTVLMI